MMPCSSRLRRSRRYSRAVTRQFGDSRSTRGAGPLEVPLSLVKRVEVSRGKKSNAGKGALRGGLVGASIGVVLSVAFLGSGGSDKEELSAASFAVLGGVGVLTGAAIGAGSSSDRWEGVPLDQLRVDMVPRTGGLAIRLSLASRREASTAHIACHRVAAAGKQIVAKVFVLTLAARAASIRIGEYGLRM